MSENSFWGNGKVVNKSSKRVWVLFDHEGVVYARILEPKHKSPKNVDADAVGAYNEGETIDGFAGWWKLANIQTAFVTNDWFGSGIGVTAHPGFLRKTVESDWGTPGGNIEYVFLPNWGEKL